MYATQMPHQYSTNNNQPNIRLYQVWRGNNIFCLGGRLIFGPDVRSLLLTVSLIVTPVIFFCVFVSQNLVDEFPDPAGKLITAACVVFTLYVVLLLFITSARDPGIIPRSDHPPEDDGSSVCSDWPGVHGPGQGLPHVKDIVINGVVVKVKYCQTCMLYRHHDALTAPYVTIVSNVLIIIAHGWVNRNYRIFFMFVSSTTMLCIYVFAFCWVNIKKIMDRHHCNIWMAFVKSPPSGILILFTFISGWFVGGLTTFHLYLIFTNQTTYENFRYHYNQKTNPYNLGCVGNIVEIFFSKIPKSKNKFRENVKVNATLVSATSMPMGHALSSEMLKLSLDSEIGKRQAVVDEDLEDIRSQMESIGGSQQFGIQPRNANWDHSQPGDDTCYTR
ncbi:hypothetical protein K2173_006924 [Erythroxylum novogranatense]|uniref:S-acyltransferase n=1 Tax=Erythroxylum novogranatense TaxID=1862640 RepID=A0AAV8SZQ9_9ROSI|nr:hypothetical protein K2173_006924 [Erythroxylum novogranatense]